MRLEPGVKIKHYVLERQLGGGAFGEVWVAKTGDSSVAIKFMREQLLESDSAPKYRERLRNEVDVLSRLQHPHIPVLYDQDLSYERPYLVMQYIAADSYEKLIATGEMHHIRLEKRLEALKLLAETVAAIHASGFIHRDIKPASINGVEMPYLLDFGIALELQDADGARQDVGTAIYMPPGDVSVGVASDYYSFAVVAYEVLFGHHPIFDVTSAGKTVMETRQLAGIRIENRDWRLPSRIPPDELPGDLHGADLNHLDEVFQMALEGHYTDLRRFLDDLESAIFVPGNRPYLENPLPIFPVRPVPTEEHYTDQEVDKANRITDNGIGVESGKSSILWISVGILVMLGVVVAGVAVFCSSV